jgi:hypothetical protein
MKRCPQCEFIYEDDQGLCDMDGTQLLYDSGPAAFAADASMPSEVTPARPHWRALAFAAIIVFALGAVLCVVYYASARLVSSKREISAPAPAARNPKLETPTPRPTPNPAPAPPVVTRTATAHPAPDQSPAANVRVSRASQTVTPSTAERRPTVIRTEEKQQTLPTLKPSPANANQKSDSKLGSFLKKTRRILKKPF